MSSLVVIVVVIVLHSKYINTHTVMAIPSRNSQCDTRRINMGAKPAKTSVP